MGKLYRDNAFRILGVSVNSNRTVIRDAQQALRTRVKAGSSATIDDPLSTFDAIELNEAKIRDAFNRLENSSFRLRERLFWFEANTSTDKDTLVKLNSKDFNGALHLLESDRNYSSTANLARLLHASCIIEDPDAKDVGLWTKALKNWQTTLENDDYWEYFLDVEMRSGFEPLATVSDVIALRKESWKLVLQPSVNFLQSAIDSDGYEVAQRHLHLIRNSGLPQSLLRQIESEVLNPIEATIEKQSDEILKQLNEKIPNFVVSNKKTKEELDMAKSLCDKAYQACQNCVLPLMKKLRLIAGPDSEAAKRSREIIASCLRSISITYHNAPESFQIAEKILKEAQMFAKESIVNERIKEDMETISKHATYEKTWENLKPIDNAPSLHTINGFGTTLYGKSDFDPESSTYMATLYFVFFFIPVWPLARYRVRDVGENRYSFYGKAPLSTFNKVHIGIVLFIIGLWILQATMHSQSSSSNRSSYTNTRPNYSSNPSSPLPVERPSRSEISSLKSQIENAKAELNSYEITLQGLTEKINSYKSQIEFYANRVKQMERNHDSGLSDNQYDYQSALNQHNDYVALHNSALQQYTLKHAEYKQLLEAANTKIDNYNRLVKGR